MVERIAKRTGAAKRPRSRRGGATRAPAGTARRTTGAARTSGYYLVDDGLAELERLTGYRPTPGETVHRWVLRHPNVVFVRRHRCSARSRRSAAVLWLAGPDGARGLARWCCCFALLPANDIAVSVVNQLVTASSRRAPLPKLDLHEQAACPPSSAPRS